MPCIDPQRGWRAPGGSVVFNLNQGWRDRPVTVNCGRCLGCRKQKATEWGIRCVHEAKQHERNGFVTLTYSPESVPADGSLRMSDFQGFCKRLRRAKGRFRYFHCGEYGAQTFRPHYHALLFGLDQTDFSNPEQTRSEPHPLWRSQELDDIWSHGQCWVGQVNMQTALYVAKYTMKRAVETKGEREDRYYREHLDPVTGEVRGYYVKPEYVTMSKKPGIGHDWYEQWKTDVYPSDQVVYDGRVFRPPRYYDKLLEREDPHELQRVKSKRTDRPHPCEDPDRRYHRRVNYDLDYKQKDQRRNEGF